MLRLLYKTFLVSLLSGSLLMLDFSYKGSLLHMNSVQAETVKTEGIQDSDLMGTLTMTAVGVLAARLYSYKFTTDIMLAAAGGGIFIAGEIATFGSLKGALKDIETEIYRTKEGELTQEQIAMLERLKKSYEEAKKTSTTKKSLQMAAAAAFAAAGISAYTMAATDMTAVTTCTTGITTALAAIQTVNTSVCAPLVAGTYTAAAGAACEAEVVSCTAGITAASSAFTAHELARQAGGPSAPAAATTSGTGSTFVSAMTATAGECYMYTAAVQSAFVPTCSPVVPQEKALMDSFGVLSMMGANLQSHPLFRNQYSEQFSEQKVAEISPYKSFLRKGLNFIFPEAHAELFSAMGIASALAVKFLLATSATLGPMIDNFMLIPSKRAIVWGILGGLTYAASTATDNQIKKLEGNIEKIDAILKSMYALHGGVATAKGPRSSNPTVEKTIGKNTNLNVNENNYKDIDLTANGGKGLPCLTAEAGKSCPSFSDTLAAQPDVKSLPDYVQQQIGSISKLTDGINNSSKISGSSLSAADSLAGQSNALNSALNKSKKAFLDKIKMSGSKLDLDKMSAQTESDMKKAVQKELDSRKMSAGQMLASFGAGTSLMGSSSGTDANKAIANDKNAKSNKKPVTAGIVAIPAPSMPKMDSDAELEAKLAADKKAAEEAELAAKNGPSIDDYELKNDITQDKDSSIFDLISNRYQKSGYPRLFKRIK